MCCTVDILLFCVCYTVDIPLLYVCCTVDIPLLCVCCIVDILLSVLLVLSVSQSVVSQSVSCQSVSQLSVSCQSVSQLSVSCQSVSQLSVSCHCCVARGLLVTESVDCCYVICILFSVVLSFGVSWTCGTCPWKGSVKMTKLLVRLLSQEAGK